MRAEEKFVNFIINTTYDDLPSDMVDIIKKQVLTIVGTTIGGSHAEGCDVVVRMAKEIGGKPEATILVHGGKVPAPQAAFINGMMARALDFCDALAPGPHIGAATIASALAAAELQGGCSGKDFLAAIAVGAEMAIRLNLSESQYGGFDPTAVLVVFSSTAAAAKIMGLSAEETWHALGLAFNRSGGSFQSHVDGSLAVRVNEGWVAETGITCARLARHGITGPKNFLEGVYGYFQLFGRGQVSGDMVTAGLGKEYNLNKLVFKLFPSCGSTQGATEAILYLQNEVGFQAHEVENILLTVPPYTYKLVGHPFKIGNNPKVDAQFSVRYCIANALIRKEVSLADFEEEAIKNPEIIALIDRIEVKADEEMGKRGHTALDLTVKLKNGKSYFRSQDYAPGFPEKPLTNQQHMKRFYDCIGFSGVSISIEKVQELIKEVDQLEMSEDIRDLIELMIFE